MNAMRESVVRPRHRRRRPVWGIVAAVLGGILMLFALGFGVTLLLRDAPEPVPDAASPTPVACATTLVTPAQVLPAPGSVPVNVYNATDRVGLAADTANVLSARGFIVKKVGNDPGDAQVQGVGELRFGPKGEPGAEVLTRYFPGMVLVPIDRANKRVDVVLGPEFTKVVGEAEVAAALASPSPSMSGPGCPAPAPSSPAG